jgi:hypothetical protein
MSAELADGGKYTGELKGEAPHGPGTCSWPDGSSYEGEWRSGKMHGKGAFRAGQHTYVGAFFKVSSVDLSGTLRERGSPAVDVDVCCVCVLGWC